MSGLLVAMARGAANAGIRWATRRISTTVLLLVIAALAGTLVTHQSPSQLVGRAAQLVRAHLPELRSQPAAAAPEAGSLARLPPPSPAAARQQLSRLRVAPAVAVPYARRAYGSAWADVDGNGCNQRDDVLLRDVRPRTVRTARQGGCSHDVLAGTWVDPYTGAVIALRNLKIQAQAQAITIDHLVPLKEANRSGAAAWSPRKREMFANDLRNLVAVGGSVNSAKGDDDPARWMPPLKRSACAYLTAYVSVKTRWALSVDPSERRALVVGLRRC